MTKINSAHSVLNAIGGEFVQYFISGWYADSTTQPKRKSKPNQYGKNLMSMFDSIRKAERDAKKAKVSA